MAGHRQLATAPLMNPSFAQIRRSLYVLACAFALSATAFAQDPAAAELSAARMAVDRADQADADQYAPDMMATARQELEQAQRASQDRREKKQAPAIALRAAADADLARALSEEAVANAQLQQKQAEVAQLQRNLSTGEAH